MPAPASQLLCVGCGVPIRMAAPDRALVFGCAACGTVLDLSGHRPFPLGQVRPGLHGPEGLVEIGRLGTLGEHRIVVAGRIRLGVFQGSGFTMLDDWQIVSRSGLSLWLRERNGGYELLVPMALESAPSADQLLRCVPGEVLRLGEIAGRLTSVEELRVLHIEGEQHQTVSMSQPAIIARLEVPDGVVELRSCGADLLALKVEPLEDRAMWSIFDYHQILRAYDALFVANQAAERRSRTVARSGMALLLCSIFGAIAAGALVATGETVKEGWARHDFRARDNVAEVPMESVALAAGLGIYTISGECGLDPASRELSLIAESPSGRRVPIVQCRRAEPGRAIGTFSRDFSVDEPGKWRFISSHVPEPDRGGRAHLTFRLTWQPGDIWPLVYALLGLLAVGLCALVASPLARRAGLAPLERAFEDARAELALALRRRGATAGDPR